MNSRLVTLISALLVAFAIFVMAWQLLHWDVVDYPSIAESFILAKHLPKISSIVERNKPVAGLGPALDLVLPKDARVFMPDMTGSTNYGKIGFYYFETYYLFPREIGVSVDQPARQTKDGFPGRTAESNQEILTMGFDVRLDVAPDCSHIGYKVLRDLPMRTPVNPDWFGSNSDTVIAFLFPLLTALAGMWLFRFCSLP